MSSPLRLEFHDHNWAFLSGTGELGNALRGVTWLQSVSVKRQRQLCREVYFLRVLCGVCVHVDSDSERHSEGKMHRCEETVIGARPRKCLVCLTCAVHSSNPESLHTTEQTAVMEWVMSGPFSLLLCKSWWELRRFKEMLERTWAFYWMNTIVQPQPWEGLFGLWWNISQLLRHPLEVVVASTESAEESLAFIFWVRMYSGWGNEMFCGQHADSAREGASLITGDLIARLNQGKNSIKK